MLTFEKFTGINNVLPSERLKTSALKRATNVDIGLSGELRRRQGFTRVLTGDARWVHEGDGFTLAVVDGNLVTLTDTLIRAGIGGNRVWYVNLPDGRTAFSNGAIAGVTNGVWTTPLGVPLPPSVGVLTPTTGGLYPGDYQWQITYVRRSDGLEGGASYSGAVNVTTGGVQLSYLPVLPGYDINVYLTSHGGEFGFFAGKTSTSTFEFRGKNDDLVLPCRTEFLHPLPAGTMPVMWRGRVLMAIGNNLVASRTFQWELHDARRDVKQFPAPITTIQPVDDGIYVGTTEELAFLAGAEFDKLSYMRVLSGPVVRGSGTPVRGELVTTGNGVGRGSAMLCIADGTIVVGMNSGEVSRMTEGRYKVSLHEVSAAFRMVDGIPQYIVVPAPADVLSYASGFSSTRFGAARS